ncbi:putative bifunctional diguanylate cyclase/phosphodiesterase [Teredinibacter haidensis]|uniref:putative bifunctional diguanylate cyclase/phosphodiesterase n=1 Tax=Teredinibacter haidensis TaxID=2731755 RepID=UPI000949017E|nr:EAL domain-containing protein [Teredinibacter haidensis]
MLKRSPGDFRSRILWLVLTVVLASGIVSAAAVLWNYDRVGREVLLSRVTMASDIISQNVAASVLFDDRVTANEILATYSADRSLLLAVLVTNKGDELARYTSKIYNEEKQNAYHIRKNVVFEGEIIGQLGLVISKDEVYEHNVDNGIFVLLLLGVVFIVAYGITVPLIRSILVPLLNLHQLSEKIAKTRDYSLRVEIQSEDEVGRLSKMFNQMVEQIEHRDSMLEKQVGHRTNELEKLAEEFRFRAFHDSLTGLPNRALLNERFAHSIEHASRTNTRFACLLLDLDDFKAINDTKGHEFGDELLIEVANRLKAVIRSEDLVCRLGGDEFVLVLNDLQDVQEVEIIARKILAQINREFKVKTERVTTAASMGGAVFPDHGENLSTIKRHADVAMYRAKDEGKNRFCLFSEGMEEDVKYRLMILNDLRPAIEEKQLEIYLQPKIDPVAGRVSGCEALVRWNHPEEGFLTPDKFVPYAEDVGMIAEIDYFVIRECCELIVKWSKIITQPIPIAFNLSGRHFHNYKIVEVLEDAINQYHLDPSMLEAEITEAVLIQDPDKAQKIVHAIKSLGLGISLDDFGTGYSSLNYLRTLPIDTVKLDRSFVANIDSNPQDRRLTRGIVSLAQGLNLKLVAEGVENEMQVRALLELGCVTMQGYHFLPPASNRDFLQWYIKNYSLDGTQGE